MANAVPPAMPTTWPSESFSGAAAIETASLVGASTLGYHCAHVWMATWSLTYWFSLPKTSMESLKLLTLA